MAAVNFLTDEELSKIRALLKADSLEIVLHAEWGSRHPQHREQIHSDLKKKMAHAYPLSDSSISHCPSLGGYVFAQQDLQNIFQIGFDLEESSRISEATAKRICQTDEEFQQAPSPSSLWSAKEAAFKALKGPSQPTTVSDVVLTSWVAVDSHIETFQMQDSQKYFFNSNRGVVIKKDPYSLAFFICRP